MRGWITIGIVCVGLIVSLGASASADTVSLRDGTVLSGEVSFAKDGVVIRSETGTLTVPGWRVASINMAGAGLTAQAPQATPAPTRTEEQPTVSAAPRAQESPAVSAPAARGTARASRAPTLRDALSKRVNVDFSGVPLNEVLTYVRQETGVNMALTSAVQQATDPVDIQLNDVMIETLLELVLEPRGYTYERRPGELLYVRGQDEAPELVVRVYNVRDLLISTEDYAGSSTGGRGSQGRGTGGRSGSTGGTRAQFDPAPNGAQIQYGECSCGSAAQYGGRAPRATIAQFGGTRTGGGTQRGGRTGAGGGVTETYMAERAENLILLIKNVCGEGTWIDVTSSGLIEEGQVSAERSGVGAVGTGLSSRRF